MSHILELTDVHRSFGSPPVHACNGVSLTVDEGEFVAIARAIIGHPALLLADEPTGNLDSRSGASIVALLRELNEAGTTIIVITHDNDLAASLPRQIAIRDGEIVSDSAHPGGGHGE